MNKIEKDKIQLICYCGGDISFENHNNEKALTSALKFIPYDLIFSDEEMKNIINMLLIGNNHLKITIEKE